MKTYSFKKLSPILIIIFIYLLLLAGTLAVTYEKIYENKIYPKVEISGIEVTGWTKKEVADYFKSQKTGLENKHWIFEFEGQEFAINATKLELKFDSEKMASAAFQIGRNPKDPIGLIRLIGLIRGNSKIEAKFKINEKKLVAFEKEISSEINIEPIDALFTFDGVRVSAFNFAKNGRAVNAKIISEKIYTTLNSNEKIIRDKLPVVIKLPKIGNQDADKLGIKELLGTGVSYFYDSIPSRIYNIRLASSKFNGVLIKPGEEFSFLKTVGSITKLDGYKEAYVIFQGKTVLGDGGGVCQVSTTMYRAALFAGLPITDRTSHSYRVGYYEPPLGFDATIFQPGGPNLKFKNDTGHYILIQTFFDEINQSLTFSFYGTSDGRVTEISDTTIVSTSPAPPPTYQDDPNLPKGVEKQIDTAHSGAKVYFTRRVLRGNEVLIDSKTWSNYIPWATVILRGTK